MSWILGQIGSKRAQLEGRLELLRKELADAEDELTEVAAAERVVVRIMADARSDPDQGSDGQRSGSIGVITVPVRGTGALSGEYAAL